VDVLVIKYTSKVKTHCEERSQNKSPSNPGILRFSVDVIFVSAQGAFAASELVPRLLVPWP